jgi:nitrogen fixation negative regulator NifL
MNPPVALPAPSVAPADVRTLPIAEADFRTLVEQLPAIVWTGTLDGRIRYVGPQLERILGVSAEAWIREPRAWMRRIHPEDRARVLAAKAEHLERGTDYRCEYRFVAAAGRVVWVIDEAVLVRDGEGRPVAVQGVALDITERKQAEAEAATRVREIETLHRISEIVRLGRPLDDVYAEITAEIEAATGFPQGAIALFDEERQRVVYRGARGLPCGADGSIPDVGLDESFCGLVVRTGAPLTWTERDGRPRPVPSDSLVASQTRTFVGVPMTVAGRIIGAIGIGDRAARPIDGRLVQLTASIANHVGGLIERARTREALEASERHFHAAFETALDAMVMIDDRRTYVGANSAAARLFGVPVEQILGRRFGDFSPLGHDLDTDWSAVLAGRVKTGEWRLTRTDGVARDVEFSLTTNFIPGRHLAVLRDVTERRREEAARRVRATAMAAAASGIVITDVQGRVEWTNPEFTRMSGYTLDEVRGRTPSVLKSGQHDAAFYAQLWATILGGRVWRGDMVNRRKDGSLYFEEMSITPVRMSGDPASPITHFVAVKQDVTERKRAEQALRRSEEYHRSLLDNALDLIVVLDAEAIVRYASPSVERLLGYHPDEMVGTSTLGRLHPDDLPRVGALLAKGRATPGFTASVEYRIRHKDGTYRLFEAIASNLLDHPSVAGIIVNARDVTERRQSQETQERLQEHLRHSEKLAAMSELLAGVAHELNNPLSVVIGHTAILTRATDPSVSARAEKISRAAERCGRIVKNFLALARQYPTERTAVNLNGIVRDALEVLGYALRVDDVAVVTELGDDLPTLAADGHQLQQVLVNLVTNAHQAMRTAPAPRRLAIRTGAGEAGTVWLEVADSGPGIAADVQPRLFEPFFTTKPVGEGTGLGLSICRGIVEDHGGRISVESTPGHGATFRIQLPVGGPVATPPGADQGPVASRRRILVVDDEAEVAGVLAELLRRDGHEVDTALNGLEGLERLRMQRYDLVVSDIRMPQLDGVGLWTTIKQEDPALARRFVFCTGDTLDGSTAQFIEQTGAPSLRKPFTLRDVRLALARIDI